ncbi:hypothetical protein [Streptomyces sp. NPDC055992]|uniref:hypothetical protein n=1 Tax=Streptomyces sp. NPDC055992 TaxID=3345673 RepID=UPI0035E27267
MKYRATGRPVEVLAGPLPEGQRKIGTGGRIADGLFLTAQHVIMWDGAPARHITIRFPDQRQPIEAHVVWLGEDEVDAAVLRVTEPRPPALSETSTSVPRTRWGVLSGDDTTRATAVGFLKGIGEQHDKRPDIEQVGGYIDPGSSSREERYMLNCASYRDPSMRGDSRWAGFSGTLVTSGQLTCGLVEKDTAYFGGRRLTVVPLHVLAEMPGFRKVVQEETGRPLVLESVELQEFLAPWDPALPPATPAALLRPEFEVAPYRKTEELGELRRWCETDELVSGRLVTGRGGQGKSRLARELAKDLLREGWVAGRLQGFGADSGHAASSASNRADELSRILRHSVADVLLLVDYAEAGYASLRVLLDQLATSPPQRRVRLLMLARSDGEWWRSLTRADVSGVLVRTPLALGAPDRTDRSAAFAEAVRCFTAALSSVKGYETATPEPVPLALPSREVLGSSHPLTLYNAALATVLGPSKTAQRTGRGDAPMDVLLDHEYRYWSRMARRHGLHDAREWETALTAAFLVGASSRKEALGTLKALEESSDVRRDSGRRDRLAEMIHALYPTEEYWGSPQPDSLTEYHLKRALQDDGELRELLARFLPQCSRPQIERALGILGPLADATPSLDRPVFELVTRHAQHLAVSAARVVLRNQTSRVLTDALQHVRVDSLPDATAVELYNELPRSTQAFADVALSLAVRRHKDCTRSPRSRDSADRAALARARDALAYRLFDAGQYCDALHHAKRAAADFARLTSADPDAYLVPYGLALENLAALQSRKGRKRHALRTIDLAMSVHERRREQEGDVHRRADLSAVRRLKGGYLHDCGRHEEALVVLGDALADHDRRDKHAGSRSDGASIRELQGKCRTELAQYEVALKDFDSAVELRENLSREFPDTYLTSLADTLLSRCKVQMLLERSPAAMNDLQRAVDIHRDLVHRNSDDHAEFRESLRRLRRATAPRWRQGYERIGELLGDGDRSAAPTGRRSWTVFLTRWTTFVCERGCITCPWTCGARNPAVSAALGTPNATRP